MSKKSRRERKAGSSVPYSGQILGSLVDAMKLGDSVLTGKTAKRFFASGNASEYKKRQVYRELGQVLVDLGLVPDVGEKLPEGSTTADALADGIVLVCKRWDLLMQRIQSRSAAVTDPVGAGQKFLRLATVDVALRMLGFAHLAEVELPEPHVPLWAQHKGAGVILRGHVKDRGVRRFQLAQHLDVSPTTVDNWLGGNIVPGREYIQGLARELSEGRPMGAEELEAQLRRQFTLARSAEQAASVVGWEEVAADVEAAFWFAKFMQESNSLSRLPEENGNTAALMLVLMGSLAPFARLVLLPLARRLEDYEWSDDIYAVASSPEAQFEFIAGTHSGVRAAAGLAQDFFDVVERGPEDFEVAEAIRSALFGEMRDLLPLKLVTGGVPHPLDVIRRSIEIRRDLTRRFPESAEAHYQLGSWLGQEGRRFRKREWVDEGIMECKVAAGLEPRWDAPAVETGIILCNLEDWDGALNELATATGTLPAATPHLRNVRGYALMNGGRLEEALIDYLAVIEARPDFATAWRYAAHCAFSLGNPTEGLRYAKRARSLGDPTAYDAWDNGAYGQRRKRRSV